MIVAGFLGFVLQPASPWLEILAGLFGIGVGLTLDEFALWLYLDDVYWSEEGRSSVDAVIFAAIIGGAIIVGFVPLDAGDGGSTIAIVLTVAIELCLCAIVALKGKISTAVIGMFIPPVGPGGRDPAGAPRLVLGPATLSGGQPQARQGHGAQAAPRPARSQAPGPDRRRPGRAQSLSAHLSSVG